MDEELTYEDALDTYYTLKQRYEKKYNTLKGKIINDTLLSKKQKQKKIKEIKMPCISCKKLVGTNFQEKERKLVAVCGNQTNPCKLNIQIKKSETLFIKDYLLSFLEEQNNIENDIIRLKLSFLFGFIHDDELADIFEELKQKYSENKNLIDSFNLFMRETINIEERQEQIKLLNLEKFNTIKEIKNIVSEFLVTKNNILIKDSIELLLDNLNEILEKLRENKYHEMFIEPIQDGNIRKFKLIQNENSINDLEYPINNGEVLFFVV
jgi:hypothetical protein